MKKRFTEEQTIGFLPEAKAGYRYEPVQDRNCALKEKIIALAQRYRRQPMQEH